MYLIKSVKTKTCINVPTSLSDFTPERLSNLLKDVTIAEHYVVLATVIKTSLFKLATDYNSKQSTALTAIPIIAKTSNPVKEMMRVGDKAVITPTDLERGTYLPVPVKASFGNIMSLFANDNDLRVDCFQKKYKDNIYSIFDYSYHDNITEKDINKDNETPLYLVEFRIVPESSIIATVPLVRAIEDFTDYTKAND